MTTGFKEAIEFVRRNPNGFLATLDGDQPRVRPMTVWLADQTGFYFYTSKVKPITAQLAAHPRIEIAFHQPGTPPDLGILLRIAGELALVPDMAIRTRLYKTMPWLKQIGTGKPDCPSILVFKMATGQINFWTWANNLTPNPWTPFP